MSYSLETKELGFFKHIPKINKQTATIMPGNIWKNEMRKFRLLSTVDIGRKIKSKTNAKIESAKI